MSPPRGRPTEVDAYVFIKRKLGEVGWCVKNPERNVEGQVWTQNECLSNPNLKALLGRDRPENIVKVTESRLWAIESKSTHGGMCQALDQAHGYAAKLSARDRYDVPLVSGVAGNNDDGFIVSTEILLDGTWTPVTINGLQATGFLSPDDCARLFDGDGPNIADPPIDDRRFVLTAERINEILDAGTIQAHDRAKVVSALLLSVLTQGSAPNIEERDTSILIGDINTRVQRVLDQQGKRGFEDHIRIPIPAATNNHAIYRQALVKALQELLGLNIHSAMQSGADWLGTFYEVFLKYARWAHKMGVVLTPRHITKFAAQIMNITSRDIVYDPTCGTGGFLVAAFEEVRKNSSPEQLNSFKRRSVFGLELDDGIAALAVVNMIFRGDGKNNIEPSDCMQTHLSPATGPDGPTAEFVDRPVPNPPVTRVLMNPPFTRKQSIHKDYEFVSHALDQLEDHGLLFSILPYAVMAKGGAARSWRLQLLGNHTLVAVVTLPIDVFYPISAPPVGIVVRKGQPHPPEQKTLWVRAETDGHLKSKGKRLSNPSATSNQLEDSIPTLRAFINDPAAIIPNIPRHIIAAPIDFQDRQLELVPEAYLEQEPVSRDGIRKGVDHVLRECAAFLVRNNVAATWKI